DGNPEKLKVIFYGEVPGNFEQATSVTVIGKPDSEGFVAENMLVKCPSKYQGEDGEEGDGGEEYEERSYPATT
ncbi:MAG: cytochrome c maturation protein CcmE, partial [Candidatus Zixiibacteriota bacterium]